MATLKFEKVIIPSADFGGESSLPPVRLRLIKKEYIKAELPEEDGLFVNYGRVPTAFPYREQNMYNRELNDTEYDAAILENNKLRAMFIPALGGKLWSLIDKTTDRELLFCNDVVRPCNLAVRNAWTSGGVEWNMGFLGHSPMTCSLINTAKTELSDGTPVLRFYWFERVRCCIAQMDIFLPDGSGFLYVRTRITNPNENVVPMYWWSNIATVQEEGARVIVPAEETYLSSRGIYKKTNIPVYNGVDITYPLNSPTAYDYFWKTEDESLKYICQLDKSGYGLATSSTDILKGRKLFVWGDSRGGRRWQNFLTSDNKSGSYNEIQIGLARTQIECVPMPPRTVWEWVETYGAMQADGEKIHADWMTARKEVESIFAESITKASLEKILCDTREMAKSPAETVFVNQGWATLERMRREMSGEHDIMCTHLEFADTDDGQSVWIKLLKEGTVGEHNPKDIPISYQIQAEWLDLLRSAIENKDKNNWYAYYLLGTGETARENNKEARAMLEKSLELAASAWASYALAVVAMQENDSENYVKYMLSAFEERSDDVSLAKEVFRCLYETNMPEKTIEIFECADNNIKENPRCCMLYAYALAKCDRLDEAEAIVSNNGKYLIVPDIREAETVTSDLWEYMAKKRGKEVAVPRELDFRMNYNANN